MQFVIFSFHLTCVVSLVMGNARFEVPFHRATMGPEEESAVLRVLRSGWLTAGPECEAFEREFATYTARPWAASVNSCTAALHLAYLVSGISPGDEVIMSPFTFVSTAAMARHCGATVRLADIRLTDLNIDPVSAARLIGPRTRAIVAVHYGGNACEMDTLQALCRENNLSLIEDCAHAIEGSYRGQLLGTFGRMAAYSFYPNKNLTALEGGMVTGADPEDARRVRLLRRHGMDSSTWQRETPDDYPLYDVLEQGFKYNMTDVQAAVGRVQLTRLTESYRLRKAIVNRYSDAFSGLDCVEIISHIPQSEPSYFIYVLRLVPALLKASRASILRDIQARGVQISVSYTPVHQFKAWRDASALDSAYLSNADVAGETVFSLPLFPGMTPAQTDRVIQVVTEVLQYYRR